VTNLPNATGIKTKISKVKTIKALKNAKRKGQNLQLATNFNFSKLQNGFRKLIHY
jgi:hypothetical protein